MTVQLVFTNSTGKQTRVDLSRGALLEMAFNCSDESVVKFCNSILFESREEEECPDCGGIGRECACAPQHSHGVVWAQNNRGE